jgi:hypothetical protein
MNFEGTLALSQSWAGPELEEDQFLFKGYPALVVVYNYDLLS